MTYRIFKNRLKKAHKSMTIWFNAVGVGLLAAILADPSFISFLDANDLAYINLIGNVILRFKTNSDMSDK